MISPDAIVFWAFVLAWLVVVGLLVFVYAPRLVREGRRIVNRVIALVNESPLPLQIAKAEGDLSRMRLARERVPALQRRALAAVTLIRTTSLVPSALVDIVGRVRSEIRAFRQALR